MKSRACVLLASLIAACSLSAPVDAATNVRSQTSSVGGTPHIVLTTIGSIVQRHVPDLRVQISAGKSFPQLTADLVNKRADLVTTAPGVTYYMQNQSHMYSKMAGAREKAKTIRYILAFPFGPYHWVVRADSDIKELADIKGKRIFGGPRASGTAAFAIDALRAEAGLEPDKDYDYVSLDWASGGQAFQDKQIDVFIRPANIPLSVVQEFAMAGPIRMLGIKPSTFENPYFIKNQFAMPGQSTGEVPPGAYGPNQVNETSALAMTTVGGIASRADYDPEVIYKITKAVWENLDELHAAAPWLKQIVRSYAFTEIDMPLHLGAYRYYKEAGFDIPAKLIPPEAL